MLQRNETFCEGPLSGKFGFVLLRSNSLVGLYINLAFRYTAMDVQRVMGIPEIGSITGRNSGTTQRRKVVEVKLVDCLHLVYTRLELDDSLAREQNRAIGALMASRTGHRRKITISPHPKPALSLEESEARAPLGDLEIKSVNALKLAGEKASQT